MAWIWKHTTLAIRIAIGNPKGKMDSIRKNCFTKTYRKKEWASVINLVQFQGGLSSESSCDGNMVRSVTGWRGGRTFLKASWSFLFIKDPAISNNPKDWETAPYPMDEHFLQVTLPGNKLFILLCLLKMTDCSSTMPHSNPAATSFGFLNNDNLCLEYSGLLWPNL